MKNYTDSNLISVPYNSIPTGTLAIKVGNNIFLAGGGGVTNFYKCATVNTSNQTWTGYKAVLNNGEYSFESAATTGLTYDSSAVTPVVGGVYSDGALIKADLYTKFPTAGLVFYAPLQENNTATTGQSVTISTYDEEDPYVTYGTVDGIACATLNYTRLVYETTGLPTGVSPWTMSAWAKFGGSFVPDQNAWIVSWGKSDPGQSAFLGIFYDTSDIAAAIHSLDDCRASAALTSWNHFAVTFNGSVVTLWVNGQYGSSFSPESGTNIQLEHFTVGGHVWSSGAFGYYFNGSITSVRLYNRVLTGTEIGELASEFTPITSSESSESVE